MSQLPHVTSDLVDRILLNTAPLPEAAVSYYSDAGATPVRIHREALAQCGTELVGADLLAPGELIRHDPRKLAEAVIDLMREQPVNTGF